MDSQKTREYNLKGAQKTDEYEITGEKSVCEKTVHVKECGRMTELKSFTTVR